MKYFRIYSTLHYNEIDAAGIAMDKDVKSRVMAAMEGEKGGLPGIAVSFVEMAITLAGDEPVTLSMWLTKNRIFRAALNGRWLKEPGKDDMAGIDTVFNLQVIPVQHLYMGETEGVYFDIRPNDKDFGNLVQLKAADFGVDTQEPQDDEEFMACLRDWLLEVRSQLLYNGRIGDRSPWVWLQRFDPMCRGDKIVSHCHIIRGDDDFSKNVLEKAKAGLISPPPDDS